MSILIVTLMIIFSAVLSALFVFRDAKSFAVAPPTPLLDLDRMYDYVFDALDPETGQLITPEELRSVINYFLKVFWKHQLIAEDLSSETKNKKNEEELSPEKIALEIKKIDKELNVETFVIEKINSLIFTYMEDIGALT